VPLQAVAMKQAVFIDRDGAICKEVGYLRDPSQFQLIPGASDAIRLFNRSGLKTIVVTNQSGVARGYFSEDMIAEVHRTMSNTLGEQGAYLDGIYYCPHHPQGIVDHYRKTCDCRKPATGLLKRAAFDHAIELSRSYLIGDKLTDMECAYRAGVKAILVLTGCGAEERRTMTTPRLEEPAFIAADLLDAARWIIEDSQCRNHGNSDNKIERDR